MNIDLTKIIFDWQNLIGSLIGSLIAILGAVLINIWLKHNDNVKEEKKQYGILLMVLHDLQLFITRCETYLNFRKDSKISFNKIVILNMPNYIGASQTFDLDPEVYNSIQEIYNVANVIKYNIDKSEVIETNMLKKNNKNHTQIGDEVYVERSILCDRYWNGLSFVEHYLEDIYHKFNFITLNVRDLTKKHNHLKFPSTIQLYTKDYVQKKIQEYNLRLGKLNGH